VLRARSPHGVFHGRPPFDRQPARLSDHGPPQPAPELCGSRRYSEGLGLSVVGGATTGRDTGKRSKVVAKNGSEDVDVRSRLRPDALPFRRFVFGHIVDFMHAFATPSRELRLA
jgi:hypothetical protein